MLQYIQYVIHFLFNRYKVTASFDSYKDIELIPLYLSSPKKVFTSYGFYLEKDPIKAEISILNNSADVIQENLDANIKKDTNPLQNELKSNINQNGDIKDSNKKPNDEQLIFNSVPLQNIMKQNTSPVIENLVTFLKNDLGSKYDETVNTSNTAKGNGKTIEEKIINGKDQTICENLKDFFENNEKKISLFFEYTNKDFIKQLYLYSTYYNVENFVIITFNLDIFQFRYSFAHFLPSSNVYILKKNINLTKGICEFKTELKIENSLWIFLAVVFISFVLSLYATLRLYLLYKSSKDPLITNLELETCPVMTFVNKTVPSLDNCMICMEDFQDDDVIRILYCEHYFHKECIDPWLKEKSARCPYCRMLIKIDV